ncbi:ComEA family DNA-binding protein [uncultured Nocardioides sp.]|uniref:ComEA family DNA-binding protein n=1 Tax=uncultured Nocardioides sp. TaxID=198441 RepID=UPI0025FF3415|nr:ComEA family DNA-binding protein [uncultured Nocardioides sp.]
MRSRRPSPEHQEAVSRRLALLSAELATVRPEVGAEAAQHTHTRIRAVPSPSEPEEPENLPVVPVPGRHARPGAGAALGDLVPETLRGRVRLGQGAVTVVALLLCAGLAVTCWSLVRSEPRQLTAPAVTEPLVEVADPPAVVASSGAPETPSPAGAPAEVTVDVAGKVRRPGIAVLPAGSRVVDALEAAGGARRGIDLTSLNLARPLVDGEQVLVGVAAVTGPAAVEPGTATTGALVDLNTADQATLETLPNVGPVTAGSILAWRTEHGGFTAVEELLEVDGIGDATLAELAPLVTV